MKRQANEVTPTPSGTKHETHCSKTDDSGREAKWKWNVLDCRQAKKQHNGPEDWKSESSRPNHNAVAFHRFSFHSPGVQLCESETANLGLGIAQLLKGPYFGEANRHRHELLAALFSIFGRSKVTRGTE